MLVGPAPAQAAERPRQGRQVRRAVADAGRHTTRDRCPRRFARIAAAARPSAGSASSGRDDRRRDCRDARGGAVLSGLRYHAEAGAPAGERICGSRMKSLSLGRPAALGFRLRSARPTHPPASHSGDVRCILLPMQAPPDGHVGSDRPQQPSLPLASAAAGAAAVVAVPEDSVVSFAQSDCASKARTPKKIVAAIARAKLTC